MLRLADIVFLLRIHTFDPEGVFHSFIFLGSYHSQGCWMCYYVEFCLIVTTPEVILSAAHVVEHTGSMARCNEGVNVPGQGGAFR